MALPDQVELLCMAVEKMAAAEVEKIVQDARDRRDRILQERIEQIRREQEEQKIYLKRRAFQDARRKVDAAELKARRMVMATREEIFDRIMENGRHRLQELREDSAAYARLLDGLIRKAAGIILEAGSRGVDIKCRQQDRTAAEEAISALPDDIRGKITLSREPVAIEGGIMAFSKDGKQLVDLSFEAILKRIEPDIRAMTADRLFKGIGTGQV